MECDRKKHTKAYKIQESKGFGAGRNWKLKKSYSKWKQAWRMVIFLLLGLYGKLSVIYCAYLC